MDGAGSSTVDYGRRFLHRSRIAAIILVAFLGAALLLLAARWPFGRSATIESLERISSSDVRLSSFRKTFFPHPGYIAQTVTFTRGRPGARPIARIGKITCQATWWALITFTHRINHINLEGVEVDIPAHLPPPVRKLPETAIKTTVTELVANGAVLEIEPRHTGSSPVRFEFPELVLRNLARNKAITFQTDLRNPNPPGEIEP